MGKSEVRTATLRMSLLMETWNRGRGVSSFCRALSGADYFSYFISERVEVQGDEAICARCPAGRSFRLQSGLCLLKLLLRSRRIPLGWMWWVLDAHQTWHLGQCEGLPALVPVQRSW